MNVEKLIERLHATAKNLRAIGELPPEMSVFFGPNLPEEAATALAKLQAENERLNQCLRYEQHREGRIGTHGPNCHTWGPQHYECALAKLEAAENALASIKTMHTPWTGSPSKDDMADLLADIHATASRALGGGE